MRPKKRDPIMEHARINTILTINGGSSSIRFALFRAGNPPERLLHGLVERIGQDHLPLEIALIEGLRRRYPELPHVACFDTAFHHTMPRTATLLPLPRRFDVAGVRRYGYHGLSYSFVIEELARTAGREKAEGRVILAHLGNGSSLAAVNGGRSIDTTMSFTPASGLPMGTRSGDLDPGLAAYLQHEEGMTPEQFDTMVRRESGLLGMSGISSDMRDLLACEGTEERAREAVDVFCYHVRKGIGAFAAALGGLDTLVFTGGIGENSPEVRARACAGLGFLGVELHDESNRNNGPLISTEAGRVAVYVIRTDEELMIARSVVDLVGLE